MPFSEKVGFIFNCGFFRTLVYEHLTKIDKNDDSAGKKKSEEASGKKNHDSAGKKKSEEASSKKNEGDSSGKPSLNFSETFKLHFQGPRFAVGDGYFVRSKGRTSQFERHVETVIKSFKQNFVPRTENGLRDKYLTTFSSNNWNKLTLAEKAAHSLSNCQACALNSPKEQKLFPLKPTFIVHENDHVSMKSFIEKDYQNFDSLCKQRTGQPFADLANKFPQKLGLRDTDAEVKAANKATLQECTKQCSASLQKTSLLTAHTHDISLSKMDKIRKSQCFEPPKPSGTQKKRFPVKSSECSRYDELMTKLKGWDTSCPFVATEVADEFGITGTDRGHRLKLLAIKVNPTIPNLGIQAKPKSVKRKFEGTNVSMPAPPSKKVLAELDSSMVEHGELETGIPCACETCPFVSLRNLLTLGAAQEPFIT